MKSMMVTKLKITTTIMTLCLLGVDAGGLAYHGKAAGELSQEPANGRALQDPPGDPDKLVCKVYPVADLVRPDDAQQLELLIQTIRNVVDPSSWVDVGGSGTLDYYPLGMSLVINQSLDKQERVKALLDALRKAKTELTEVKRPTNLRIEATAQGMKVEASGLRATALRISYDESKGLLLLEGSADSPARLISSRNGQDVEARGLKITCFLSEGKLVIESLAGTK
jgi:hypothetical protein